MIPVLVRCFERGSDRFSAGDKRSTDPNQYGLSLLDFKGRVVNGSVWSSGSSAWDPFGH